MKDIQGRSYEQRIAAILNYGENLHKWKTNAGTLEGLHYKSFKTIVDCFRLDAKHVKKITAKSGPKAIGKLPSGGNPKTDVLVQVAELSGNVAYFTISCKRSSSASVSVHQYTADAFADVLDRGNHQLRSLLNAFQAQGSLKDFGKENCQKLTKAIAPYVEKLTMWALGGYGGEGVSAVQCASHILIYDNNDGSFAIHKVQEYGQQLLAMREAGNFGTPFGWTYPSKRRGQSIQLKCKIIK